MVKKRIAYQKPTLKVKKISAKFYEHYSKYEELIEKGSTLLAASYNYPY